ncbi:hypothetical protein BMS3Bbin09_00275 [bacterium BMS3Bbin09]|nr:hypothetical protein BMS3Bbin09_00275 [bacterium BMS3Bbin09]
MSLEWSEWAAVPAAIILRKFLAVTVGRVAPQTPLASSSAFLPTSLHGPMWHTLQHAPVSPIGQGFIFSTRSKQVSMLWALPHLIISSADVPALLSGLFIISSSEAVSIQLSAISLYNQSGLSCQPNAES